METTLSLEKIREKIYDIRGSKVMLDKDLATFYKVKPIALRQQVRRNLGSFPSDFMFTLNEKDVNYLVSQNVIPSKKVLGGYFPLVFTEHGVLMLSSILKSPIARKVNIEIVRAFISMRRFYSLTEVNTFIKEHSDRIKSIEKVLPEIFAALKYLLEKDESIILEPKMKA